MKNDDLKVPRLRFKGFEGGWKIKKLNEVLDKVSEPVKVEIGKTYREIGIRSHGKGLFHKEPILGETLGDKRVFWIKENAFIVNIVFAWEQAIARTTSKEIGFIASHRFPMFQSKNQLADVDFIFYLFSTKKGKSLLELASPGGAGRNKTLGQKEFDNLKLTLPTLPEQKKIAAFLTLADEKINQLARKKQLLETYKKGVMQGLFSREIRFEGFDGAWEVKRLGEIGRAFNGLSGKSKDDFGTGFRFITYKQIFDKSVIDLSRCGFVEIQDDESQNKARFGDVFFTGSSETPSEVGFASVLLEEVEDLYLNSFCFGYRINSFDELNPRFAQFLFHSEKVRADIIQLAQGSTRYNMSKTQFLKLEIEIPSKAEQEKIANYLTAIDEKTGAVSGQLSAARVWKKGLLQQLFV